MSKFAKFLPIMWAYRNVKFHYNQMQKLFASSKNSSKSVNCTSNQLNLIAHKFYNKATEPPTEHSLGTDRFLCVKILKFVFNSAQRFAGLSVAEI